MSLKLFHITTFPLFHVLSNDNRVGKNEYADRADDGKC